MSQVVAKAYAEAMYELALELNKVEAYKNDVKLVDQSLNEVEGVKGFLESVRVSKEDKKAVLENCFKDKVDRNIINFLSVLVDKRRILLYKDIFHEFYIMCNQYLGIKEGILETARPFTAENVKAIEEALSKEGQKVELKTRINESLISGFKVIFDDRVIDSSMRIKINKMNEMLLRKDVSLWN